MNKPNRIVKDIENRLRNTFNVTKDTALPDGSTANIVASRNYFSWKTLAIVSQHIVILEKEDANVNDIQHLFEEGYKYGKKQNRIPLFRGLQFGYMIIPIIITSIPDKDLIEYVESQPTKRWCIFEFPVVISSSSRNTYYFKSTAVWGAVFFSDLRKLISQYIIG